MIHVGVLVQGLGLEIGLIALRLICARSRLAPIPIRLPSLAILIWLIHAHVPASWSSSATSQWLDSVLHLSRSYAVLQLLFWLGLELPRGISWWPHPPKILKDLAILTIGSVITIVVLQQAAKINVVGLVTTSAILTAVIGLAAQEALKDLFAGIMLRVDSPFQEGDYLELGDSVNGWVDSLTLLSTKLRHVHGAVITLPNSMMWQKQIHRFAPRGPIARELHINLDRELPPNEATEILLDVAKQSDLVLDDPAPEAMTYAYHDWGITYELEVWQEDPTDIGFDSLRGDLLSKIWYALERIGQRAPFPIQEYKRRQSLAAPEEFSTYSIDERVSILRRNALFGHLEHHQLSTVAALTRCIRFANGEKVVIENEDGDSLYQIVSGKVAVIKTFDGGEQRELAQLSAPAIFGEMSVFNEEPRSATVQAMEQSVLLEVERDDVRPLLEQHPEIVEEIARIIGERRAALLKLTPEIKAKQGNDLLEKMRWLFLGN